MATIFHSIGSEFQVNTGLTDLDQTQVDLGTATNGRLLIAFASVDDIYFRFVNPDGSFPDPPLAVTDGGFDPGTFAEPDVVSRPAAGAVVFYAHQLSDSAELVVGYSRVDKHGNEKSAGRLFEDLDHYRSPAAAALADGRTLVVATRWLQFTENTGDLAFDILNGKGTSGMGGKILDRNTGSLDKAAIAAFGNKAFVVYEDASGQQKLVGRFFDGDGFRDRINVATTGTPDDASVAALPDGRFVVVWNNEDTDAIQARFIGAAGQLMGPVLTLAKPGGFNYQTSVAALPDGGFIVACDNDGGQFSPRTIREATRSLRNASTGTVTRPAMCSSSTSATRRPIRRALRCRSTAKSGRIIIAWEDQHTYLGPIDDAFPSGIRGHLYQATGDILLGKQGADRLRGGDGDEHVNGRGGKDKLWGRGADDVLIGHNGADVLRGGNGDDVLRGGHGRDIVRGGGGDDYIVGGKGRDMLAGGPGKDIFDFDHVGDSRPGAARDVILDFGAGDLIDLSGLADGLRRPRVHRSGHVPRTGRRGPVRTRNYPGRQRRRLAGPTWRWPPISGQPTGSISSCSWKPTDEIRLRQRQLGNFRAIFAATVCGTNGDTSPPIAAIWADKRGGDVARLGRRGHEDGVNVGGHRSVHPGHLHLVVEVGRIAETADDDTGARFPRGVHHQPVEGRHPHPAGRVGNVLAAASIIRFRSATGNIGCLEGWTPIATITSSARASAAESTSTWPLVSGSKVPG